MLWNRIRVSTLAALAVALSIPGLTSASETYDTKDTKDVCRKISPCKCQFDNHPRQILDLSPLNNPSPQKPYFQDVPDSQNSPDYGNFFYSYQPCTPFSEGKVGKQHGPGCRDVLMCKNDNNTHWTSIGDQHSMEFYTQPDVGHRSVILLYNSTDDYNVTRTSLVMLVCTKDTDKDTPAPGQSRLEAAGPPYTGAHTYMFLLYSPYACFIPPPPPPAPGASVDGDQLEFVGDGDDVGMNNYTTFNKERSNNGNN